MKIKKIIIENYRGIKNKQEMPLSNFTSIVGKNDSGKSIILNAIATFLNPKDYPIVESDFNDVTKPICIECHFVDDDLKDLLEAKIGSKIKKNDGLKEFLTDLLFSGSLIVRKKANSIGKKFDVEQILIEEFKDENFSMLYMKSDEELNQIVENYRIDIPVKGKGRNSKLEKIKYIKRYCLSNKFDRLVRPIKDDYKLMSLLPNVELFVSDYGLRADTGFKTQAVSEIKDYFERETADETKKLKQVEKEIQQEMNNEAKAIKNYMLEYTPSLEKIEITPNTVWKDAIKSVDVNFQFKGDSKLIPMSHKGTGYRRLFMVARFRYLAEKNRSKDIIYLIEEPEAFLHPSAQESLLEAFKELSEDNQIVITTHSPVFAGSTDYNSVILCKKEGQSVYEYANEKNKKDFIMHIVGELGIKPSYNLRDHHEKIVFVESKNDAIFYDLICQNLLDKKLLNNKKILVLPFGGGEDIESFINIDYFDNSGRDLFLIIDSDKHQNNEEKQRERVDKFNKKEKGKAYMLQKSCIENYYHPRAIERVYSLSNNTFDFFSDDEDVKRTMIRIINEKNLKSRNIKIKNNIEIFKEMRKKEWKKVVEQELIDFLSNIVND